MNDFWNNISRYPQFFIGSLLGLILIILTPVKNVLKVPKLRFLIIFALCIIISATYLILKNMIAL